MKISNYPLCLIPVVLLLRLWRRFFFSVCVPVKTLLLATVWRIECGRNVKFLGRTIVRSYDKSAIKIGDDVTFTSGVTSNLVGLNGPTILCADKGAKIEIGSSAGFSSVVINARSNVKIGQRVLVGGNVRIFDHDFHPLEARYRMPPENGRMTRVKPVEIEDDVFIGTNAIILKGTQIGARSIVAAGSVVFGLNVPPDSLVKGNPAVIVNRVSKI